MIFRNEGPDHPNGSSSSRGLGDHQRKQVCRAHDGAKQHLSPYLLSALAAILTCLCSSSTSSELRPPGTRTVFAPSVHHLSICVQHNPALSSHCLTTEQVQAQTVRILESTASRRQACREVRTPSEHRRQVLAEPPGDPGRKPNRTQARELEQQAWIQTRNQASLASLPRRAKRRTPRPPVQVMLRRLAHRRQRRPGVEADPYEALRLLARDRQDRHHRFQLMLTLRTLELPCLGRRLLLPRRPSIWQPLQVHPWYRMWDFQVLPQQQHPRLCLRKPQHIDRADLRCQVQRPRQHPRLCHRVLPLQRQPRPTCHRELFQPNVRDGQSLSPSSRPTGELASGSACCVTLPNHRQPSPGTGQEDSAKGCCCLLTAQRSRHPKLQTRAQVGMVLTMQELRGHGACGQGPPVNHTWNRFLSSDGRADSTRLASDVTVLECLLPSCMPVSTRQVLRNSYVQCTPCTSLATLFVAVDVSAGSLSCSHCVSPPGPWTDSGAPLRCTSLAQEAMGKKKRVWIPPPPLDCTNLVADDALVPGATIQVTGGAHTRIHGLKGFVLPSSERHSTTVNIKLFQGHATLQSKVWCVDRSNVEICEPDPPCEDDGLHPSLRWRLRPPPLTVFSARYVLGWESLASMVPPKPEKRPQHDAPAADQHRAPRLWQGVRRISKEGALLPQPKAKAREDPPLTKLQKELLARMPLLPKGTPKQTAARREHRKDLVELEELEEVIVEPAPEPSGTYKLQTAQPKPKKRPAPRDEPAESARESEPKAWPLDPSWPPPPASPGQPPPRTESLDKPFAAIIQSGKYRAQQMQASRAASSSHHAPQVQQASTTAASTAIGPKRHRSIWFDSTPASAMATAMKRKKASRRQMYQTVLMISAANRAADAAESQRVYKRACAVSFMCWSPAPPLSCAQQHVQANRPRSSDTARGYPGQTHWECSQPSSQLALSLHRARSKASTMRTRGLPSPLCLVPSQLPSFYPTPKSKFRPWQPCMEDPRQQARILAGKVPGSLPESDCSARHCHRSRTTTTYRDLDTRGELAQTPSMDQRLFLPALRSASFTGSRLCSMELCIAPNFCETSRLATGMGGLLSRPTTLCNLPPVRASARPS